MTRFPLTALIGVAACVTAFAASPAAARDHYVQPYIELGQVVTADLTNDETLTYSQVAAGVDAGISTARTEAQISYRYERRIAWDKNVGDDDVHSGLARALVKVSPGFSLEGGALATRTRFDIRGAAPGNLAGNVDNVTQVYSLYAGPNVSARAGVVDLNAGARFGYTKVEAPKAIDLGPGQPRLDAYDDSKSVVAQASAAVAAGEVLPVGITVSGAYDRENAGQLSQRYEGYYGRGDVVLPVSPTLAVRAGAGYEKITASQKDALRDGNGNPVTDRSGRFVTDANSPRRIAYNTDGLIYDAGVIWRPSRRLELQANAGYRYGGETYFGSLSYAASKNVAVQVGVYDAIQTFGRQLRDGLVALPTSFQSQPDPFGQQFSGCVFGGRGQGGVNAGGCLNDVFQSVSTASYRARGIDGTITAARGRTTFGFGAGYANRKLFAPRDTPGITYTALEDQSAYAQFFASRELSRVSSVDVNVYGNWYDSGQPGADSVYGGGANASYSHSFGRLGGIASLGVYGFDQDGFDTQWSAQALVGARYTF